MTPLQLKQLVAAGGIAGELAGMVIERDDTAKVAAKCMKEMQDRIDKQIDCLAEISSMCIGDLTMSYKLDAQYIGQAIYVCTGKTNPELNEMVKNNEE